MIAEELERNIYAAREDARRRGLEFVTVEHLVLALLDNSQVREILNRGADADGLRRALEAFVQNRVPKRKTPGDAPPTEGFKRVIRRAFARPPAQQQGRDATVNGLHILAACTRRGIRSRHTTCKSTAWSASESSRISPRARRTLSIPRLPRMGWGGWVG